MRVWHLWAFLFGVIIGTLAYTRGIVAGLNIAGHGDIVGWSWWWLAAFLLSAFVVITAWMVFAFRRKSTRLRTVDVYVPKDQFDVPY
jgi:hypothetical protein